MGETPGHETAITVTGLKPNHFYNIRVVAVGVNNFQAGSPVVRLRTLGKDGQPQMSTSQSSADFADQDNQLQGQGQDSDESDTPKRTVPSVETAPALDGSLGVRDFSSSITSQRRNTINRRHSPSVASMEQAQYKLPTPSGPEMTLDELNRKFESIRKETEDTLSQFAKDEAESQQQEEELKREKERKRLGLKEKEEQTTQLKAAVRTTMEQVRVVEKEKSKKEQQLKDKESKITKVRDNIAKLERDTERMRNEKDSFDDKKAELESRRDERVKQLAEAIDELQDKCANLEAELKDKGKQLQDLKESRQHLPGSDDQEWVEQDVALRRDWEMRRQGLHNQLMADSKRQRYLRQYVGYIREQLGALQQQPAIANFYNQADSSNTDFDTSVLPQQAKRLSLNGSTLSPPNQFATADPRMSSLSLGQQGFASSMFVNMGGNEDKSNDAQSESEFRAQGGPLSPTAHALLPSGIFDDAEGFDSRPSLSSFLPEAVAGMEDEPKSPASSRFSFPMFSSPQGSSQHLPFPSYNDPSERRSSTLQPPPAVEPASTHRLHNLFSTIHRSFGHKTNDDAGLAFGSLKPAQSQSFPRGAEDYEAQNAKRRISFSWNNRNSEGDQAASSSRSTTSRRLGAFADSTSALFSRDRGAGSRPASIASAEMKPRPSNDSGSFWGATGEPPLNKTRLWSPNDPRWASRSGSRRPSVHGSPAALTTTLASAEDEILDEDDLLDPQTSPSQVGVIGSRLPGGSKASLSQRLNPAAPTFMGSFFRKDKDSSSEKGKARSRKKDSVDLKGKGKEVVTPSIEVQSMLDDSPSDSRMSRDTFSVHTQTSVSESHESLPLDHTVSSTTSDTPNVKDPDNAVKKLFRKGSSSKFSLSSRLGKDSGLFKKTPGSAANSERNMSSEYRSINGDVDDISEDASHLGRSYDSVTSSPSLGPLRPRDSKENKLSNWFSIRKKDKDNTGREKESIETDHSMTEEE